MKIEYDNKNRAGTNPYRVRFGHTVRFGSLHYKAGNLLYLTPEEEKAWHGRIDPVQVQPKQTPKPEQEPDGTKEQPVVQPAKKRRRRPATKRRSKKKAEA